jgi:hypothetical protein
MNQAMRRFMEPQSRFDRFLYALQTIFLPYSAAVMIRADHEFVGIFCIVLWVPMAFYTVERVISKWRA